MKRKRLILTTVLLACVAAVVVPFLEEMLTWIAYHRVTDSDHGLYYLEKHLEWAPGAHRILPDQPCHLCLRGIHDRCETIAVIERFRLDPTSRMELPFDTGVVFKVDPDTFFSCTCTNPGDGVCDRRSGSSHVECRTRDLCICGVCHEERYSRHQSRRSLLVGREE